MVKYIIAHSAKGSTWEKHKYLREFNGKYYYPDSYEGGRHLPKGGKDGNGKPASLPKESGEKKSSGSSKKSSSSSSGTSPKVSDEVAKKTVSQLALDVVSGKLGSISQYKEALGSKYDKVQERVKEIANKASIIDSSKKQTDAMAKKLKRRKPISAPQTEKKTKTLSKEELDEENRAKKLQAKTVIKTDEKKEEPKTTIQNEKKSTSSLMLDRARAASEKKDADKLAESVVNKNAKRVEEALKKTSEKKASGTKSSGSSGKASSSSKKSTKDAKSEVEDSTEKKESESKTEKKKTSTKTATKSKAVDISEVLSVYNKKKKKKK